MFMWSDQELEVLAYYAAEEIWYKYASAEKIESLADSIGLDPHLTEYIIIGDWSYVCGKQELEFKIESYDLEWSQLRSDLNTRSLRGEIDRFGPEMRLYWDPDSATESEIVHELNIEYA